MYSVFNYYSYIFFISTLYWELNDINILNTLLQKLFSNTCLLYIHISDVRKRLFEYEIRFLLKHTQTYSQLLSDARVNRNKLKKKMKHSKTISYKISTLNSDRAQKKKKTSTVCIHRRVRREIHNTPNLIEICIL